MQDLIYSSIYAIFHIVYFIWSIKNKRKVLAVITGIWSLSSIASIFYVSNPYISFFHKIELLPYIYLFVLYFITTLPLINLNKKTSKTEIICNPKIFHILVYLISLCSIEPLIEIIVVIFSRGIGGLADIYIENAGQGYDQKSMFSFIGRFLYSIEDYMKFIAIPLFFLYLTIKRKHKIIIICLILAILNPVLFSLSNGHRFYLITAASSFLFNYFLFKDRISIHYQKMIKKYSLYVLSAVGVLFLAISISRFGSGSDYQMEGYGTAYQFIRYLGESHSRFNSDVYHQNFFFDGRNSWRGFFNEEWDVKDANTTAGFITNVFFTYIGDFVMDYGLNLTFAIISIASLFMYLSINRIKRCISLGWIIIINLYANVLLFGFTYFVYMNGFKMFFFSIIVSILIMISSKKNNLVIKY